MRGIAHTHAQPHHTCAHVPRARNALSNNSVAQETDKALARHTRLRFSLLAPRTELRNATTWDMHYYAGCQGCMHDYWLLHVL